MNMKHTLIQLIDLPDEILILIFKTLNNVDLLYSLMGINVKLTQFIRDPIFTNRLTLFRYSSNDLIYPLDNTILDRFCLQILPEIHHKIKWLNVEPLSMERILLITNYSNLHGLGLYNIEDETFRRLFADESTLNHIYKKKISKLVITMTNNNKTSIKNEIRSIYTHIFTIFINLQYLNFFSPSIEYIHYLSFDGKPPNIFSSILTELHVNLRSFDDCLYLLDGCFIQLRTFYVNILSISRPFVVINNKEKLPSLTSFSLTCDTDMSFYWELIVPLIHRMLNLEELTLYIELSSFKIFIDGNNLKENIIYHLSRLNKFVFNILSIMHLYMKPYLPTNEEIEHTFANFTTNKIISSVDYFPRRQSAQCRIYTYPFTMSLLSSCERTIIYHIHKNKMTKNIVNICTIDVLNKVKDK